MTEMQRSSKESTMNLFSSRLLILTVRALTAIPLLWLFLFLHLQPEGTGGFWEAVFNAVLVVVWSLLHSLMARGFVKQRLSSIMGHHSVRAFYVIISGLTLALMLWVWKPLSGTLWTAQGWGYRVLTVLYLLCIGGAYYTTRYFDSAEFIGIRGYFDKPSGNPSTTLNFSVDGPYAYCRHPMYTFFVASLWIGPTMTLGRFEFALLATIYVVIGTFWEEKNLRAELGPEYETYRENVPMWIPRSRPWEP